MNLGLEGRRALITGGSKGIGLATARGFAAEGVDLCLVARDAAALADAAKSLRASVETEVVTLAADLSEASERERVTQTFPDVDVVVNNAGSIPLGSIDQVDEEAWRQAWDLKVYGYIDLTRRYLEVMQARRRGVIVNVIGASGERLLDSYVAGSTGNTALMAFTRIVGSKSTAFGVRVVGVNPGPVASQRGCHLAAVNDDAGNVPTRSFRIPFGRLATPDEIATSVVFLSSDRSSYTSGTILTIDGGITYQSELA
ncbi:short-chain dehydrogenase/reductase [Mycolicibacterium goodii]|uniref:short-chain dehydrogenase/reductase n=1 Tax=Mycolicibacterium goodii TaxID=134601 RepID=UPI001F04AF8D|nr:short-chain dehydrogenase/reductase [Mycolicibacterium goodii]ULN44888.1 short-chain dehydrogenase/reductase [Mycolicibacterium goodii]